MIEFLAIVNNRGGVVCALIILLLLICLYLLYIYIFNNNNNNKNNILFHFDFYHISYCNYHPPFSLSQFEFVLSLSSLRGNIFQFDISLYFKSDPLKN